MCLVAQVRSLHVHPTLPWVLACDEADSVVVYDTHHQRVLLVPSGLEEQRLQVRRPQFRAIERCEESCC